MIRPGSAVAAAAIFGPRSSLQFLSTIRFHVKNQRYRLQRQFIIPSVAYIA
jgi:hypothetical protein